MNDQPHGITGILIGGAVALVSIILVLGSFAIALMEGGVRVAPPASTSMIVPSPTQMIALVNTPTLRPTFTSIMKEETLPSPTTQFTETFPPTFLPSFTPTFTFTPIGEANVTSIPTVYLCGPPPGWVLYTVQPGDTLYRLSRVLGVSITEIQSANCLGNETLIRSGEKLYLPRIPPTPILPTSPVPPIFIPTVTPLPTESPTATEPLPSPMPTEVPTLPPTQPPTDTPIPLPTNTPEPTTLPVLTATLPNTSPP